MSQIFESIIEMATDLYGCGCLERDKYLEILALYRESKKVGKSPTECDINVDFK